MVKSIAERNGVKMPSFLGFLFLSIGTLVPLFLMISYFGVLNLRLWKRASDSVLRQTPRVC